MAEKCKVAIYCRLANNDGGDGTMAAQQARVLEFAIAQLCPEFSFYTDNGASGSHFDRGAFARMDADIRAGIIDTVYVSSLSRIGRNLTGVMSWLDDMRQNGVVVRAADGSINGEAGSPTSTYLENLRQHMRKGGKRRGA